MLFKYNKYVFFVLSAFLMLQFSCANYKKITYFKNISDSSFIYTNGETLNTATYQPLIIRPDDILQVIVSTIDPQSSISMNLNANEINNNMNKGVSVGVDNSKSGYLVDKKGDIELPVLGSLHVGGLTTSDAKELIHAKAIIFFKNPVVNVRITNFTITVLGEVAHPGTYPIEGERANVLDALGLAGDMTIYGKRQNVMLMRMENGGNKSVARFDLNNASTLTSPFFYLRQGDVIYVEPNKGKAAATDMSATKTYAILGSLLSVVIVLISRL